MIPGGAEWVIIGGVVLVLFGASAIPRFARSIGRAKKEFEKGQHDGARDSKDKKQVSNSDHDGSDSEGNVSDKAD